MTANYNEFKISARYAGKKCSLWGADENRHHIVTVVNTDNGKKTSFDFWTRKIEDETDLIDAFRCFCDDAVCGSYSFEDFCSDLGYDTDSRKAEKTWKTCKRSFDKFLNLTNYSVDMLYGLMENLNEVA